MTTSSARPSALRWRAQDYRAMTARLNGRLQDLTAAVAAFQKAAVAAEHDGIGLWAIHAVDIRVDTLIGIKNADSRWLDEVASRFAQAGAADASGLVVAATSSIGTVNVPGWRSLIEGQAGEDAQWILNNIDKQDPELVVAAMLRMGLDTKLRHHDYAAKFFNTLGTDGILALGRVLRTVDTARHHGQQFHRLQEALVTAFAPLTLTDHDPLRDKLDPQARSGLLDPRRYKDLEVWLAGPRELYDGDFLRQAQTIVNNPAGAGMLTDPSMPTLTPGPDNTPGGKPTPSPPGADDEAEDAVEAENETALTLAQQGYPIAQNDGTGGPYNIGGRPFKFSAPTEGDADEIWRQLKGRADLPLRQKRVVLNLDQTNVSIEAIVEKILASPSRIEQIIVVRNGEVTSVTP